MSFWKCRATRAFDMGRGCLDGLSLKCPFGLGSRQWAIGSGNQFLATVDYLLPTALFPAEVSMNDTSPNAAPPPPTVDASAISEVARDVFVIRDRRVPLVPNIGIIGGRDAVLVVDTGMGRANGARVLDAARGI